MEYIKAGDPNDPGKKIELPPEVRQDMLKGQENITKMCDSFRRTLAKQGGDIQAAQAVFAAQVLRQRWNTLQSSSNMSLAIARLVTAEDMLTELHRGSDG